MEEECYFFIQTMEKLLTANDFNIYFNSAWRQQQLERFVSGEAPAMADYSVDLFRDLRDFVLLEIEIRNGKRAGVLSDLSLADLQ